MVNYCYPPLTHKQVKENDRFLKGENLMTNELGVTLSDIEAKAERKREALVKLTEMYLDCMLYNPIQSYQDEYNLIRKYIEEN